VRRIVSVPKEKVELKTKERKKNPGCVSAVFPYCAGTQTSKIVKDDSVVVID